MGPNGRTSQRVQTIPVTRTTILHLFQCELMPAADGGQELRFTTPQGEMLVLPLSADHALELGKALLAPSIELASAQALAGASALRV